jgi:hypothetical protein
MSWTHNLGNSATCIVILIIASYNGSANDPSVTVGGVPATKIGSYTNSSYVQMWAFGLYGPPTGSQSIVVTWGTQPNYNGLGYSVSLTGTVTSGTSFDYGTNGSHQSTSPISASASITLSLANEYTVSLVAWTDTTGNFSSTSLSWSSGQTDLDHDYKLTEYYDSGEDAYLSYSTSGSKTENASITIAGTNKLTYWGYFIVGVWPSVAINISDSCTGSDEVSTSAQIPLNDSGLGSDTTSVQAQILVNDAGQGVDAASLQSQVPVPDVGAGSDDVNVNQSSNVTVNDVGSGSDDLSIQAQVSASDTGICVDSASIQAQVPIGDAGQGSDSISITAQVGVSDTATGVDAVLIQVNVPINDVGVGSDAINIQVQLLIIDVGLGVDAADVNIGGTYINIGDAGQGLDSVFCSVNLTISDYAVGSDGVRAFQPIEAPQIIITKDGKILLRISPGTKANPDYISLG